MDAPRNINQSNSNEWYTPQRFTNAARLLMGGIDLDPASCAYANEWIQAATYYTIETNGLEQEWYGRVWMNPPYGKVKNKSGAGLWVDRLIEQYECGNVTEAVCLVNAVPGELWFAPLWEYPICFPKQRIKFVAPVKKHNPTHSNALVYFGPQIERFVEIFSQFGPIAQVTRRAA